MISKIGKKWKKLLAIRITIMYHSYASARNHANGCRPTPPGPEGSNGKRKAVAP